MTMCPFGAITLEDRPADAPRPAEVKDDGKLAVIDPEICRACGICAANCPEVAVAHNLADDALFGRIALMTEGAETPVVGFYCKECAGAAIGLSGQHRDRYPENVRLIELPCLGRVSALHIVEAARLGAAGVFLAGCAEGRCQYRTGDTSALEQLQDRRGGAGGERHAPAARALASLRRRPPERGTAHPPVRARAAGDELSLETLEREMELIGAGPAPLRAPPPAPAREVSAVATSPDTTCTPTRSPPRSRSSPRSARPATSAARARRAARADVSSTAGRAGWSG